MKNLLILSSIPTLLNRLYIPVILNGKPSIVKSKDGKDAAKIIQFEAINQKSNKMLNGDLSMKVDFCIKKGNQEPDIDAFLKLLLDSLENVMYKNDRQIKFLQIGKHIDQEKSELIVLVEELANA